MQYLDGNVLAGDLATVFGADLTGMIASCAFCRTRAAIAELRVYRTAMGTVGRCPTCGEALVVVAAHGSGPMASLTGLRALVPFE